MYPLLDEKISPTRSINLWELKEWWKGIKIKERERNQNEIKNKEKKNLKEEEKIEEPKFQTNIFKLENNLFNSQK